MTISRNFENLEKIVGTEGSEIRNYFFPDNSEHSIKYSIAHFTLKPNKRTLRHKLKSSEIYYVLKGNGIIHSEQDSFNVKENDAVLILPNKVQFIENINDSDLEFLCIVEPSWRKEDEEILE